MAIKSDKAIKISQKHLLGIQDLTINEVNFDKFDSYKEITTAEEMRNEISKNLSKYSLVIKTAAVGDYRFSTRLDKKVKKSDDVFRVELEKNIRNLQSITLSSDLQTAISEASKQLEKKFPTDLVCITKANADDNSVRAYAIINAEDVRKCTKTQSQGQTARSGATTIVDDYDEISLDAIEFILEADQVLLPRLATDMGVNGSWYNSGDPTSGSTGTGSLADLDANGVVMFGSHNYNNSATELNFGSPPYSISSGNSDGNGYGNFEYSVPSGYYALNTKNLAEYG